MQLNHVYVSKNSCPTGTGILSAEEDENPYLHDANIVYVWIDLF